MSSDLLVHNKIEANSLIKIAPFKKHIRKTTPHKHDSYFEIIYLSEGSGYHFIDSRKFEVKPPVIYFVRKEQVHHWDLETEPDGFVVIIKKSFIEKSLDNELKSLLIKVSSQSSLHIKDTIFITKLFTLLTEEGAHQGELNFHIIEGLLKALLAKILLVADPVINPAQLKSDLYQSFLSLLNNGRAVKNSISHYAGRLSTSPQNLNAVCRKAVNLSAAEVQAECITSEAKRLLHYTGNTVAEISFLLGFRDDSHFVKYFKRQTGQTPQAFRTGIE